MKVKYIVEEDNQSVADAYEFETDFDADDVRWIAENAADDYYHMHDGWEAFWPLTFKVFIDGKSIGTFEIDQEFEPVFRVEWLS
jgi:hypothetical protein